MKLELDLTEREAYALKVAAELLGKHAANDALYAAAECDTHKSNRRAIEASMWFKVSRALGGLHEVYCGNCGFFKQRGGLSECVLMPYQREALSLPCRDFEMKGGRPC